MALLRSIGVVYHPAGMRELNVAVAGCGPCGLAAALLLAKQGQMVTIFERFEVPSAVGSGLMIQPSGLAVLGKLGLADRIRGEGARIDRLHGVAGGRTVLDVDYRALGRPDRHGIGIHRSSLFEALHGPVRSAGIPIVCGKTISSSRAGSGGRRLEFDDGGLSEPFDLVVDAMGSRSPLAGKSRQNLAFGALWSTLDWVEGFDRSALEQRYRRSSIMAGVLPIGRGSGSSERAAFFWSLRCDRLGEWHEAPLDHWKKEVLGLWPECGSLLDQIRSRDQLSFARYSHGTLKRPAEQALVHLGDAWHSASPQLGQGANMALLDAWALAFALARAGSIPEALAMTVRLRRHHVHLYQALSMIFTPVYQSDSKLLPFLRDRLVGPLSKRWPATWVQAAMVSGLLGNPLRRLALDGPDR